MRMRAISFALGSVGWFTLVAAVLWPAAALLLSTLEQGVSPQGGFTFSWRQMLLLWRSVWMSGLATAVSIVLGLPAALVIGRSGRLCDSSFVVTALAAVLFCPPMVYAFGWERLLPASFDPSVRCIGVWSLWAWPIASLILGSRWARTGRRAFEAALLSAGAIRSLMGVALPSLWRTFAFASVVIFVVLVGEYTVPHACGLIVYATELLGWAANSVHTIDSVWPALPVAAMGILGALVAWRLWRVPPDDCSVDSASERLPAGVTAVSGGLFIVAWMVPLVGLVRYGGDDAMATAIDVYGRDMVLSVSVAASGGFLAASVGVAVATSRRVGAFVALLALGWGILPGALTGDALIAGYNRGGLAMIYDHWPMMALCYASRFAWIGAIVGLTSRRLTWGDLASQARTDGASEGELASFVTVPLALPALGCGLAVAAALGAGELSASTLVRVPDYNPIAHVLVEKFHRFEEGMLVALSLFLVVAAIPAVLATLWVVRRRM